MNSGAKTKAFAALLLVAGALPAQPQSLDPTGLANAAPPGMALIPAGVYRPLFRMPGEETKVPVKGFYLDTLPVTVGDFLQFLQSNPNWTRSRVKQIFADQAYLKNWKSDLDPGAVGLDKPVTFVSWFAAKAYAQWKGKRLPMVAEWELAAGAGTAQKIGAEDPAFKREVLQWYCAPQTELRAVGERPANFWGVRDLHGLIWEWALDFNSAMLSGDPRGSNNPLEGLFCGGGAQGATDTIDYPAFMRTGFRSSLKANYCIHNLGFRCAKDL